MNENSRPEELPSDYAGQLSTVDQSLGFLLLIIFAILLSFSAVVLQRKQLVYSQQCPEKLESLPPVFPLRLLAGAITSGCLCFFFQLALQSSQQEGLSELQSRSARRNVVASFLVLAAALIRLFDISELQHISQCLPSETPLAETILSEAEDGLLPEWITEDIPPI